MRPLLHPRLVNGRSGDPAVYIETLFERRAFLFDIGDISRLSPRKLQRIESIFVSHAHIDHFIGFDHLLRLLVGREKAIQLYGSTGLIEHVYHKLHGYRWNLIQHFTADLVIAVTEIDGSLETRSARFHLKNGFATESIGRGRAVEGVLHVESGFQISTAVLEHRTPCLGFAIQETAHVNVWKNRLVEMGLPVGPWLRELKRAIMEERPDQYPIHVRSIDARADSIPLGELRSAVTVTPGQKIGYVTDVADTPANRRAIIQLVRRADILFIEAAFAKADAAIAAERAHLTTDAAGTIAREAEVHHIEPFHFSPRYAGQESQLLQEVMSAFTAGRSDTAGGQTGAAGTSPAAGSG